MFNMKANDMFHTPSSEKELIDHIEDIAKASGNPGAVWAVAMMVNNFLASRQVKEVDQLQSPSHPSSEELAIKIRNSGEQNV